MFRLKNDYEFAESEPDECVIAYCAEKAVKEYTNTKEHVISVCEYHYKALCSMRYGE